MIDFTAVSREFRSLVTRRRELFTLLGSVFAAMGILLQNILQGKLPPALKSHEAHAFATYAFLLAVPSLILALRIGKLHGGMTLNGILYARLMQEQDWTRKGDPERSAKLNWLGVSTLMFLLVDLLAACSAGLFVLAINGSPWQAGSVAILIFATWLVLFLRFQRQAAAFALEKAKTDTCTPFKKDEWEAHVSGSLEDTNLGMTNWITFVGLMLFHMFTTLVGLSQMKAEGLDLVPHDVQRFAPVALGLFMVVTSLTGLAAYLRLRLAVGQFSLQLDPTDKPFRPLRLTDSLLGYLLLAALFTVSVHVVLSQFFDLGVIVVLDVFFFLLAVAAEQVTLVVAGKRLQGF